MSNPDLEFDPNSRTIVDHVGIRQSLAAAQQRFNDLAQEYFKLWNESAAISGIFEQQLNVLAQRVVAELRAIWRGSENNQAWFERACAPALAKTLTSLIKQWTGKARDAELKKAIENLNKETGAAGRGGELDVKSGKSSAPIKEKIPDKGNVEMLRDSDGKLKRVVNLLDASRYGRVTRRAIEKAAKKGSLESEGQGPNRRIVVASLLKYFPPEK
jgi:hypothetical protein